MVNTRTAQLLKRTAEDTVMATAANSTNSIFSENKHRGRPIDQFRSNRDEWWLNVNYAETIDMKDAISHQAMRVNAAR